MRHLEQCAGCRATALLVAEALGVAKRDPTASVEGNADIGVKASPGADIGHRLSWAIAGNRVGTILLGKWQLDEVVGVGGMAQVFAATHKNGRKVAIKILRPEFCVEPMAVRRFLREGRVANRVGHPGAVAILDEDTAEDGAPFLVLELLTGETLASRLTRTGGLTEEEALRHADALLDILISAHDKDIVHRDIKPSNLFLTTSGELKVLDFGIARLREQFDDDHTRTGSTMGTTGYMAPEQARGETSKIGPKSDLWSVASTLFSLVTGTKLATLLGEGAMFRMASAPLPRVATLQPSLSEGFAAFLDRALAFRPEDRYPNAQAMQADVRNLLSKRPLAQIASTPTLGRIPTKRPWALGASAAAAVAATVWALALPRGPARSMKPSATLSVHTAYTEPVTRPDAGADAAALGGAGTLQQAPPSTPRPPPRVVAQPSRTRPATVSCSPPYTISPDGDRVPKPECL